jgi:hypothetical protein
VGRVPGVSGSAGPFPFQCWCSTTCVAELEDLRGRAGRITGLERDRDALLESYEALALEELDDLTPEERHGFYRTLRVVVYVHPDGGVEVSGEFMP